MKESGFNILEQCRKLRQVQAPPYTCPITECGKVYQGFCGIQYHLNHANHPVDKLKEYFDGLPSAPKSTPMKSHHRKKSGRYSRLPESAPVVLQSTESADENDSEELKYSVMFDIGSKQYRVNIKTPLRAFNRIEYEEKYGSISVNTKPVASSMKDIVNKLPEAIYNEIKGYNVPDAPPLPNSYIRFIEKSAEELDGEVEYDMDEEDSAWLEIMNESRAKCDLPHVSVESFELLMDRLEKESYFLVQMNKEVDSSLAVIDDEAVCSICLDGECQNSNVILFCDMCNLAVHQDCYGVPYIPEGHWLCRRCLHSPSAPVDCVLCPNNGGAFKQTDRAHWAHVVCALWIPEVRFANTVFLEPIDSIEAIPAARWRLTCYICKQRGVGACIQCHKTNCYSAFHVTCAQQAGLYMKMETVQDNNMGAVLVQKIAYCDTHAPADVESKARFQAKKESSVSPLDKMKNARRVLAKKRSLAPVISIPTIPPERIQEIATLISVPRKAHFIQRLIAYWTLKRQFRNGVPLLRRLQSSHMARRDQTKNNVEPVTDIAELYRQLKYWQSLRQDLERARLLCELVRKREKHKKEAIKVKQQYVTTALCPFNAFIVKVINQIKSRDNGEIFSEPVDVKEVPDYVDIVTHPMDLQTMTEKVDAFQYKNLDDLEADFNLMISNCLAYNAKHTIFYKAGLKMKAQGSQIIKDARKDLLLNKFDMSTGLLIGQAPFRQTLDDEVVDNTPVEEVQAVEIDKELALIASSENQMDDNEIMCKLLQLLDKSEMLKNCRARIKRVKLIKIQMASIKRKLTMKKKTSILVDNESELDDSTNDGCKRDFSSGKKENKSAHDQQTPTMKTTRKRKSATQLLIEESSQKKRDTRITNVEKITNSSELTDNDNKSAISISEKSPSVIIKRRRSRKFGTHEQRSKPIIPDSESFRVYRSSNEITQESEEETNSDDSSSGTSSCSCSGSDSDNSSSSDGDDSSENSADGSEENEKVDSDEDSSSEEEEKEDDENNARCLTRPARQNRNGLEQLQLVWAKCRGFPWFPALIINPDMPKGYVHNGVAIPSPPDDILALAKKYSEPVYLVWFYDTKRTWQWLPRAKLQPLGVSDQLDKEKLEEPRKVLDRKAVKKAYQEALVHKTE